MQDYRVPFENLQRYAKDVRTIELAIGCIIDFAKEKFLASLTGKQAPEVLAQSLSELSNQLIVDNAIFSYLGDLFMTVTQGTLIYQGSHLRRLICNHKFAQSTRETSMFKECSVLVTLYLWSNKYVLKINQSNNAFKNDLRENLGSIKDHLSKVTQMLLNSVYPRDLTKSMSEFILKTQDQMEDQEFLQMLN